MIFAYEFETGKLWIEAENNSLVRISFNELKGEIKETEFIKLVKKQLDEYFQGRRKIFDIPLNPKGTEFQMRVWKALLKIPYGKTVTYKKLAGIIGSEKAYRAVGMANNKNPVPIIIPCHRVIGSDGSLTGYAGGLEIKRKLLLLEKAF